MRRQYFPGSPIDARRPDRLVLACLTLAMVVSRLIGLAGSATEPLGTAQQIRALSPEEADSHLPVQLKAVVTFFDQRLFSRFVQDQTAGIYLRQLTNTPALSPGQVVEITGVTSRGEYAPIIEPREVRVVGTAPLPVARPTSFEQLASGRQDSQYVEISGVVRSIAFDQASGYNVLSLATGGGRLAVYVHDLPISREAMVDAAIRLRGVCSSQFNRQRQLFAIRLMVPALPDLLIEKPAPSDPFGVSARSVQSLLQFSHRGTYGHRVKLAGTVVLQQPGRLLFIQDGHFGLQVLTTRKEPLALGDRVEVLGFPRQGQYTPVLEDAVYRKTGSGPPAQPVKVSIDEALSGQFDSRLIALDATLLDRAWQSHEQFLVLGSEKYVFQAHMDTGFSRAVDLKNGSQLTVTGVCMIEPGEWQAGDQWRARGFSLLLRSGADILVRRQPPWWTLRKLLWAVGLLVALVLVSLAWVGVLRRKVRQQTGIIRTQMLKDAALKERYEALFENADDMVFTHDLDGRITSINRAGERLLQKGRDQVLDRNLLSLVAEDERATATEWLEGIRKGGQLHAEEWDFVNALGQRVRVEISSRLVEQNGKQAEVESVARDITERRRLERELLEISSREQRRIGHDLHDGICQQLAGVAYRVNALSDALQEDGRPEAAEADTIAGLISEATAQARSVARGLFPVRLEENGLLAALEELADGASGRFPAQCSFECLGCPPVLSNDKALHLYYTAQEAVLNAVNHGKASKVGLVIKPAGERYCLLIQDNGCGFNPAAVPGTGMGVRIMHYRARVIGATLEIRSTAGKGTEVACFFAPGSS